MNTPDKKLASMKDVPVALVQTLEFTEMGDGDAISSAEKILGSANPLHQIKTRLTVNVGDVQMTVGELMNARENQVIRLNQPVSQPVDLMLEGKLVARGHLVAVDDNFAIKITELPISLKV